jgi:predicted  nucleic acid-binding Zn-ribbon protein
MTDVQDKVTELNKEKDSTERKINEINSSIKMKQEEAEGLKNYLKSTQKQLEIEQKQLTTVHVSDF